MALVFWVDLNDDMVLRVDSADDIRKMAWERFTARSILTSKHAL